MLWRNRYTEHVPAACLIVIIFHYLFFIRGGTHGVCGSVNSSPRRTTSRSEGSADSNGRTDGWWWWCWWWSRDPTRHEVITSRPSKVKHAGAWMKWRHRQGRAAVSPPWPNRTNRVVKVIGMAASSNSSLSGSSVSSGKSSNPQPQRSRHRGIALNDGDNRMEFLFEKFITLSFVLNQTFWIVLFQTNIVNTSSFSLILSSLKSLEVAAGIIETTLCILAGCSCECVGCELE